MVVPTTPVIAADAAKPPVVTPDAPPVTAADAAAPVVTADAAKADAAKPPVVTTAPPVAKPKPVQKHYTREMALTCAALELSAVVVALKFFEKINLQATIILACVAALVVLFAAVLGISKYRSEPEIEAPKIQPATSTSLTGAGVTQVTGQDQKVTSQILAASVK